MNPIKLVFLVSIMITSCSGSEQSRISNKKETIMLPDSTNQYGYNRDFLKKHTRIIELKSDNSAITVAPEWQGRVMTSTSDGESGFSFGWINHELISSEKILPHINAFGGEERLWLGPEGGQFSIFFAKGKSFIFEDWQTPAFLDTKPFKLSAETDSSALFFSDITTENYSGTLFKIRVERKVTILTKEEITRLLSIDIKGLHCVSYRSDNAIINRGTEAWKKETGLLSIWMLGMYNPSPAVIVVIPVNADNEKLSGPKVNDNYFGKIGPDRLRVSDNHIFFRADGKSRGKLGVPPLRSTGTMGSYDSYNKILTLLICQLPEGKNDYVNSAWQIQENPYSGDALNSYNDGPLEDGSQMGPFYELECSSPAVELKPGESLSHNQFTIHLTGDAHILDKVSRKILGVSLDEIKSAF